MIPVAVLCGGHGTRAKQPFNKCFVDVGGRPFILHLMERMEDQGFTTFTLCRGIDGTLNGLRNARTQLGERFLVLYGDTLLPDLDFHDFIARWDQGAPAINAMWNKIDAGVGGYQSWMLDMVDENVSSLVDLQKELRALLMMCEYQAPKPWCEVGTLEALEKTRKALV